MRLPNVDGPPIWDKPTYTELRAEEIYDRVKDGTLIVDPQLSYKASHYSAEEYLKLLYHGYFVPPLVLVVEDFSPKEPRRYRCVGARDTLDAITQFFDNQVCVGSKASEKFKGMKITVAELTNLWAGDAEKVMLPYRMHTT